MKCIVIGSGPCALAAALRLRQGGLDVTIIKDDKNCLTTRFGETVTPEITGVLDSIGILDSFFALKMKPIDGKKSSWDGKTSSSANSIFHPIGLGWRLDKSQLAGLFFSQLHQLSVCEIVGKVHIIEIQEKEFKIYYESFGKSVSVSCNYLVIATGRENPKFLELPPVNFLDKLIAVNIRFSCESNWSKDNCEILIDAHKNGWFYSIDLENSERLITYYTDADLLTAKTKESFRDFLIREIPSLPIIGGLIGTFGDKDFKYNVTTARSYFRSSPRIKNIFIAGDLTHTFDPISSSGVLSSIKDGIATAELIIARETGHVSMSAQKCSDRLKMKRYAEYLRLRHNLYSSNKMFSNNPFWQRRQHFSDLEKFINKLNL